MSTINEEIASAEPKAPKGEKTRSKPFVTIWQDENGAIEIKIGSDMTPVNALALLELGAFRYKAMLLPAVSPRPSQPPAGSQPS